MENKHNISKANLDHNSSINTYILNGGGGDPLETEDSGDGSPCTWSESPPGYKRDRQLRHRRTISGKCQKEYIVFKNVINNWGTNSIFDRKLILQKCTFFPAQYIVSKIPVVGWGR